MRGSCSARAAPRVPRSARAPRRSRPRRPRSPRGSRARARSWSGPGARLRRRPRRRRAAAPSAQAAVPLSGRAPGAPVCAPHVALSLHSDGGCPSQSLARLTCVACLHLAQLPADSSRTRCVYDALACNLRDRGRLCMDCVACGMRSGLRRGKTERHAGTPPHQAQRGRRAGARWRRSGSATPS